MSNDVTRTSVDYEAHILHLQKEVKQLRQIVLNVYDYIPGMFYPEIDDLLRETNEG